ncbi:creatininase family protein [Akkermansiaceae bacterium]|nr:creatininase family protein [Akkermansiaceae bacterium]
MLENSKSPVLLQNLSWQEIASLQKQNGSMLLLPMGATEQHGPHLPIAMDTLLAESLCREVSSITQTPLLPALSYTVSQGHTTKWPGTFSLKHETFIATLKEITNWAVASGWKKILFINTHFGNDAPARVAVDQLRLTHLGKLQVGFINAFQLTDSIWKSYTEDAEDLHANQAETSLMLYLYPELVKMEKLSSSDDPDRTMNTVFSYPVAQTSLNGVTGSPSLASKDQGEKLFAEMVQALSGQVEKAKVECIPLAEDEWSQLPQISYE